MDGRVHLTTGPDTTAGTSSLQDGVSQVVILFSLQDRKRIQASRENFKLIFQRLKLKDWLLISKRRVLHKLLLICENSILQYSIQCLILI